MNLELKRSDVKRCLIDPLQQNIGAAVKDIDEFQITKVYNIATSSIIKYVILMYDSESPLWREVRSLPLRKAVAMEMSGIEKGKDNKFSKEAEEILEGNNPEVNSMIVKYITMQNTPVWSNLVAYENIYYMELGKIQNGNYGKTIDTIKALEQLSTSITQLTNKLMGGTGEAEPILAAIYKESTKELDTTVEKISNYIMESGNVPKDWSPYNDKETGEEYKIAKSKFIGEN